ncbi:hypothetical protein CMO92_04855 [Candidatus Woesearchaeota archaeon]|nr:hypothetical protein [Candidatus Woesearchaeota archaeon]|tara:strand:- start:687 stop:1613 length:927 start_codon:yes stop_codon:yes gene_type:complete
MVTGLNFLSIRGHYQLVKHIKATIIGRGVPGEQTLRGHMNAVHKSRTAFDSAIAEGRAAEVKNHWSAFIDTLSKSAKDLESVTSDMEKSQLKLIEEEQEVFKKYDEIAKKVPEKERDELEKALEALRKAMKEVYSKLNQEQREGRDAYRERDRWFRYFSLKVGRDEGLQGIRTLKNLTNKELDTVKRSEEEFKKLSENAEALDKNPGDSKKVEESIKIMIGWSEDIEREAEESYDLLHASNIEHMRVIDQLMNESPNRLKQLRELSFPGVPLAEMEKLLKEAVYKIHKRLWTLWRMGKYARREAKRAR